MAKIKTLRAHPLFSALSDRELALFSRVVSEGDFSRGTVLFSEGMPSTAFFIVQKGNVGVMGKSVPRVGAVLGEGEILGQWSLLGPDHPSAVSARVVDESSLLVVKKADFDKFLQDDPATGVKVVRALLGAVWEDVTWLRDGVASGRSPILDKTP